MQAAVSPAAPAAAKPRQVITPVPPPLGGKPAKKLLMMGTTMPPAYSRKAPGSASGAFPEDYIREVEASRDKPGGIFAWGRAHLEHAARVLGVQAIQGRKAMVRAAEAEVDRRRAPGGAGAGLRP